MGLAAFIQRWGLLRVFALSSFVSIIGLSSISGYIYFSFLQQNLLQREMAISSEFIQSVSLINKPEAYFSGSTREADRIAVEEFFNHVAGMPDVFRVNIYDDGYKIIWSSDSGINGKTFSDNVELDLAYEGRSSFNKTEVDEHEKQEHAFLPDGVEQFIESYIPVWNENREQVIGVVELYKYPRALFDTLKSGRNLVAWISLLGGLILYGLLFGVVRIAHQQIEIQRNRVKQASGRAVELNEESLRRIGSELQAGPVKSVKSAMAGLDEISGAGTGVQSPAQRDSAPVSEIRATLKDALEEILSISFGLQIPELKDLSAREAVLQVIESHEKITSTRVGRQINQMPEELDNATKICIYRLVQEGLKSAFNRAGGVGQYVGVSVRGPQLILSIGEIRPDIDIDESQNIHQGEDLELRGMRERIQSLGGEFYVLRDSTSGRVNLLARLPLENLKSQGTSVSAADGDRFSP